MMKHRVRAMKAQGGDRGAALIMALILITVVALVTAALLAFSDTSIRTTVALRDQGASAYAADGAAQAAINSLRKGTFNNDPAQNGMCFGSGLSASTTLSLPNFFPGATTAAAASAIVSCAPDPASVPSPYPVPVTVHNKPGAAILTLGSGIANEDGININSNAGAVKVHGGVFSNSTINTSPGLTNNADNSWVYARGACTGTITVTATSAKACNYATANTNGTDPGLLSPHQATYDPPAAPTVAPALPPCNNGHPAEVKEFSPGLYRSAAALNAMTSSTSSRCSDSIWHFNPGTYYFDFTDGGAHQWTIGTGVLVGGTASSPLNISSPPVTPGSCVSPLTSTTAQGVNFVFGGDSRMFVTGSGVQHAGRVEICGTYDSNASPVAYYGLKATIGTGTFQVAGENGCITTTPYPSGGGCAVLSTDNSPYSQLYIQGTTYTPKAVLDVYLNNNTSQVFKYGLISRSLLIHSTGSSDLTNPVIELPDDSTGINNTSTVVYLSVYVCPASGSCSVSGNPRLRVKVQILDPTGTLVAGARQIIVQSWSGQR
jgi:hypothetical protein